MAPLKFFFYKQALLKNASGLLAEVLLSARPSLKLFFGPERPAGLFSLAS
jgi:hypothetical protein